MSVDLKASKFPSLSPFAGMGNNPLKYIDPDGKEIRTTIKTISNSSNYASKFVNYNITMSVYNLSGGDLSKTMFNQKSGEIKLKALSGSGNFTYPNSETGKKDISYNIDAKITYKVVNSPDQIGKNDHVLIVANKIPDTKSNEILGLGTKSGQVSAVELNSASSNSGNFNSTALHEIGHNLGLNHASNGLMSPTINCNNNLSDEQRGSIVANLGMGVEAKDGTYIQSTDSPLKYQKDAKTQTQEFIKINGIC